MLGVPADLLSLLYLIAAAYTLWQLPGRWRALVDDEYTHDDRNLAGRLGFLLLTPVGVLIHELAHMAAAMAYGAQNISLSFRVYWGYVTYRGQLGPESEWAIASVGPLSSLLLGLAVGYVALRLRQPWREVGLSFAHATLLLVLVLYPGMSLIDGIGDFRHIYSSGVPTLSTVAGIVHGVGLLAYVVMARLQSRQSKREARAALTEQFSGQIVTLRQEVVARLDELEAHERVRRLEPEEREELNHLRELKEWSKEHNRTVAPRLAAELSQSSSLPPDDLPDPPGSTTPRLPPSPRPPPTNGTSRH